MQRPGRNIVYVLPFTANNNGQTNKPEVARHQPVNRVARGVAEISISQIGQEVLAVAHPGASDNIPSVGWPK